ncbi:hypothetical protein B0H19DRAFT_645339 [Mycena capillaripes]|nr:hypothetical protein B0H19DRAFT_645339 [Mycena capillaripes]
MPFKGFPKSPSFFATGQIHLQILSEISVYWARVDNDAPWKACLVCRLWRSAVMSTPKAWSRVFICFPLEKIKKKKRKKSPSPKVPWEKDLESESEDLESDSGDIESDDEDNDGNDIEESPDKPRPLALWLSRAGKSELSVSIKIPLAPRVDLIYQTIQLLLPYFPQMKALELVVESSIFSLSQMLDMFVEPTPALVHLTLSDAVTHRQPDVIAEDFTVVKSFWNFLKKSSRLRSLTLSKCLLGPMPTTKQGRHTHSALRTLTLDDAHMFLLDGVLKMIEPFLCLETLAFTSSIGCLTKTSAKIHPIILPRLTSLTVGDEIHMLASLTLPKLQTLVLDKELSKDGRKTLDSLLSNLFERGTDLQKLTISFAPIPKQLLFQVLRHIPTLIALELRHCSVEMQSLIQTTTKTHPLCPQLQSLGLYSSNLADGAALLELVIARKKDGRCRTIETLGIASCKYIDDRDVEKIRKAGGSSLKVDYSPYVEDPADPFLSLGR